MTGARILEQAPALEADAVTGAGERRHVSLAALRGRWVVVFFYPKDFTAVCPTEVLELSKRAPELHELGAEAVALSVDDLDTHARWIAEKLGPVAVPLAADPTKEIARRWGALLEGRGVATRATFIVDPDGVVQYAAFHNTAVGRSVSELVRVLEALQTGDRVPAEWRKGVPTLGR